jgi:hypothetical protein
MSFDSRREGQPWFAASWLGVGPLHTIDEAAEETEAMEKRERQEGITTRQARGRTQRWQPLQPNLVRVNEVARRFGQTQFRALLHHVDVEALERALRRGRDRAASPGIDRVTVVDYERNLDANLQRLHKRVHSGQYWPKPVRLTYIPKADGQSASARHSVTGGQDRPGRGGRGAERRLRGRLSGSLSD